MISLLLKVTALTALTLIGTRLASRRTAAVRHVFLASTLAVVLLLPIAVATVPSITFSVPAALQRTPEEVPVLSWRSAGAATADHMPNVVASATEKSYSRLSLRPVVIAWVVGFVISLLPAIAGLWQLRVLRGKALGWPEGQNYVDSIATGLFIRRRIDVFMHESVISPMTCGILRPAIVLPMDAPDWTQKDLRRALIHEVEHVRRADWLSQCVARLACAVYWFHPLVWMAWKQLALEAEHACDDAVLQRAEATAYADQLVALAARLKAPSVQPLIAMANRADLSVRVRALLDTHRRRGPAGRFSVAVAGLAAALVLVVSSLDIVAGVQTPPTPTWQKAAGGTMSFEVVSVRPSEDRNLGNIPLNAESTYRPTGGLFSASVPLEVYVNFAYKLTPEQAGDWSSHLPKWVASENYAVQARASTPNVSKDQMRLMMQSLLAERFKLKVHFEDREVPVYALTLINAAKLGPRMRLHSEGPPCPTNSSDQRPFGFDPNVWPPSCEMNVGPPGLPIANPLIKKSSVHNILMGGRDISVERLAIRLLGYADRPIVDRTGLREPVDFTIDWTPEPGQPLTAMDRDALTNELFEHTSLQQALKEQLGMKLEPTRAMVSFFVVDHVERPSDN
jgi:bla regulator protein BlaR1